MKLVSLLAILFATYPTFADELLLRCQANLTNIYEISIWQKPDGSLERKEVVEYYGTKTYAVSPEEKENLSFSLSPDKYSGPRVLKFENGEWAYKYLDGSFYSTPACEGLLSRPSQP